MPARPPSFPQEEPLAAKAAEAVEANGGPLEVTEPATGHTHPATLTSYGGGGGREALRLCGLGPRNKRIVRVVALYSLAVYFHPEDAKAAVDGFAPGDAALAALCGGPLRAAVRIKINSGLVTPPRFLETFDERLKEPMEAGGEGAAYAKLRDGLQDLHLEPGTVILISVSREGVLFAEDGAGKVLAEVDCPVLCSAFLDIYLGQDPASPETKAAVAAGLPAILAR